MTVMNDIPEDIRRAADEALSDGPEFMLPDLGVDADSLRLAIARAILAERERHGWQPIETAPKDGTAIIGRTTQEDVFACNWFFEDEEETEGYWLVHGTDEVRPREWIPMPTSPPKP